jgi:hypothetical protein
MPGTFSVEIAGEKAGRKTAEASFSCNPYNFNKFRMVY